MSTVNAAPVTPLASIASVAQALRRLYTVRFVFAIVWAALLFVTGATLNPASVILLLLYPLFDLAAAVVDARSTRAGAGLYANMALSLLATIALGIAAASGVPAVLIVWGAWAITAGIVQLIVGISRRQFRGQWAMMLSGGISVLAGAGFISLSDSPTASLPILGGYAVLGGVFFLVSALRLRRTALSR